MNARQIYTKLLNFQLCHPYLNCSCISSLHHCQHETLGAQAMSASASDVRKKAFWRLPGVEARLLNICLRDNILYCRTGELKSCTEISLSIPAEDVNQALQHATSLNTHVRRQYDLQRQSSTL